MPSSEKRKWRVGSLNGELRIGLSMTTGGTATSVYDPVVHPSPFTLLTSRCSVRVQVRRAGSICTGRPVPIRCSVVTATASLTRYKMFIDGQWVDAASRDDLESD